MPMYQILTRYSDGSRSTSEMGFYRDSGALDYARRLAGSGSVEVWRDAELIGRCAGARSESAKAG